MMKLSNKHPQKNSNDLYKLGQLWASSYEIMAAFHHKLQQYDTDYILIDLSTHFSIFLKKEKTDLYDYVKTDKFIPFFGWIESYEYKKKD